MARPIRARLNAGLLATCLLAVALPAAAQQDPVTLVSPVLTLDQERLYAQSSAAKRISDEIEQRANDLAAENRRIEGELSAEELDLTEKRATMDPSEFRKLADAFDEKVQRIRVEQDAKERDLQRLREEERQTFLRRISPVLAEIARERGAFVILDRRTVLLSADSVDVTDEAIARIDAAALETTPTDTPADSAPDTPTDTQPDAPAPETDAPAQP